ncbi:Heat shock transcription factor, X-linked member 3 [Takifugu flavidus]|uniref:Heat shock transcription factor, X-linked member 3 n=1 Tax=Takifugu flavidus TaxID=433684 RepID=A0A5C6NJB0_9TELE|nr:Heat shock transcription factor, X-linked member 3 [Takifugu flavidus]
MASILNANVFPVKLWRLVNDCENDAIVWNEQGDGIVINKGLMEKEFFSLNGFKASSSSSFVRQLNFYGFKKSRPFNRDQPNTHHYFHPYFQRSQPELLPLLRRSAQQRRVRVQEYIQTDLTERWREHRNLHDDDGYADLHNEKDLDEDQKEPSHLVTQPSEPTVPPEFPDSINGAGSSLEPHLPQSPLPQSDLKMQQLQLSLKENLFPMKLWRLVNDCNIDAIVWNDQGDGIIVHKNLIEKDFLSLSGFKASSSSSFVRQLNSYGFKKSTPFTRDQPNAHMTGPALYFHPYFQRSQPELLPLLRRCASKCRVRVKEDIQTDLTERWRDHPDLYDTGNEAMETTSLLVDVQNSSDSVGWNAADHTGGRKGAGRRNQVQLRIRLHGMLDTA